MAPSASNLSSPKYGYDFVVSVTQASINATMLEFMHSRPEPIVNICYIADNLGKPQQIDFQELKNHAGGTDPFAVPDGVSPTDPALQKLLQARFMCCFRAKIGIPPVQDPRLLPDVVVLGSDTTAVQFKLYCSEFTIVYLNPGGGYVSAPSFLKKSQPRNHPWVFTSKVNLNLSTIPGSNFGALPADVQNQIKNMSGSAFSIQQLLFDFNNAALAQTPTIEGMEPGTLLYTITQQYFLGAYFTQLKKGGEPALGYSIVRHEAAASTMTITNMNLEVCPYTLHLDIPPDLGIVGPSQAYVPKEQGLATLNYLCAADGASLPAPVPFTWNWVDRSDMSDHDGILSINRNTFANYFRHQLASYVPKVCIQTYANVTPDWITTDLNWSFTPGQSPTVTLPEGPTVLRYDYQSSSSSQARNSTLSLSSSFRMTVTFVNNTVIIAQRLIIHCAITRLLTSVSGNIFDKMIIDTYTIDAAGDGSLQATLQSVPTDYSENVATDEFEDFFANINDASDAITKAARNFASSGFTDIPLSTLQKYVFPGGKAFAIRNARFSDYQDLYAAISYTN